MIGSVSVAFVLDEELGVWAAYIPDVAAYGEGKTKEEALSDLKKAVAIYIEEAGMESFLAHLAPTTEYKTLPLNTFA